MNPRLKTILEQVVVLAACLVLLPVNVILWAALWNMRGYYLRVAPLVAFVLLIMLLQDWSKHQKRQERLERRGKELGWKIIPRLPFRPFE